MARVTVEDCIDKVTNRFDLVLLAGQRSRQISAGEEPTVDRDNDKNPVVALREIADTTIENEELRESLIRSMQRHVEHDEPEEDDMALLMAGQEWSAATGSGDDQARQMPAKKKPSTPKGRSRVKAMPPANRKRRDRALDLKSAHDQIVHDRLRPSFSDSWKFPERWWEPPGRP